MNSMYAWLLELRREYPELASARVHRWHYVARQVNHWYRLVEFGSMSLPALGARARSLRPWEHLTVMVPIAGYRLVRRWRTRLAGRPARTSTTPGPRCASRPTARSPRSRPRWVP